MRGVSDRWEDAAGDRAIAGTEEPAVLVSKLAIHVLKLLCLGTDLARLCGTLPQSGGGKVAKLSMSGQLPLRGTVLKLPVSLVSVSNVPASGTTV